MGSATLGDAPERAVLFSMPTPSSGVWPGLLFPPRIIKCESEPLGSWWALPTTCLVRSFPTGWSATMPRVPPLVCRVASGLDTPKFKSCSVIFRWDGVPPPGLPPPPGLSFLHLPHPRVEANDPVLGAELMHGQGSCVVNSSCHCFCVPNTVSQSDPCEI